MGQENPWAANGNEDYGPESERVNRKQMRSHFQRGPIVFASGTYSFCETAKQNPHNGACATGSCYNIETQTPTQTEKRNTTRNQVKHGEVALRRTSHRLCAVSCRIELAGTDFFPRRRHPRGHTPTRHAATGEKGKEKTRPKRNRKMNRNVPKQKEPKQLGRSTDTDRYLMAPSMLARCVWVLKLQIQRIDCSGAVLVGYCRPISIGVGPFLFALVTREEWEILQRTCFFRLNQDYRLAISLTRTSRSPLRSSDSVKESRDRFLLFVSVSVAGCRGQHPNQSTSPWLGISRVALLDVVSATSVSYCYQDLLRQLGGGLGSV